MCWLGLGWRRRGPIRFWLIRLARPSWLHGRLIRCWLVRLARSRWLHGRLVRCWLIRLAWPRRLHGRLIRFWLIRLARPGRLHRRLVRFRLIRLAWRRWLYWRPWGISSGTMVSRGIVRSVRRATVTRSISRSIIRRTVVRWTVVPIPAVAGPVHVHHRTRPIPDTRWAIRISPSYPTAVIVVDAARSPVPSPTTPSPGLVVDQ